MSNDDTNGVEKILSLLSKNLTEKFYIMKHDMEHLYFITDSLKKTGGLDNHTNAYSSNGLFSILESQAKKSKDFTVKLENLIESYTKNDSFSKKKWEESIYERLPYEYNIFDFNKLLISYNRALSILSRQMDYMHKTISETSYSLPPVIEPIRRYKRKIDRDDLIVLKNILHSYEKRLTKICQIIGSNTEKKENNNKEKNGNDTIIFIDYSAGTKFFEAAASKIMNLGIPKISNDSGRNDKDFNLEFIRLPYWAVKITEYVSAVAHEIVHLNLHARKRESNKTQEIDKLKNKIINSLKSIISGYGLEDAIPEYDTDDFGLTETFAEEIIADTFSLLIAGPSYYFTLFSQNISRYPLTPEIMYGSTFMYARIYALYYIIEDVIDSDEKDIFKEYEYWEEMFESTKMYLDAITNSNVIKPAMYKSDGEKDNFESVEQLAFKISIQEDIGKTIAQEIILKFFKEKVRTINDNFVVESHSSSGLTNILKRLKVENNPFSEKKVKMDLDFVSTDLFAKTLLNIKNKNSLLFEDRVGDIPEYLWDMSLYHFYYKLNISEQSFKSEDDSKRGTENNKLKLMRLPKLQIARLLGIKERRELFRDNEDLCLCGPEEWLLAKVDWMQVKRCKNDSKKSEGDSKNESIVDYFRNHLRISYDQSQSTSQSSQQTDVSSRQENSCNDINLEELKEDFVLGDYDFLIRLKHASTRRCLDWPPMLECNSKDNSNDDYCAPYTYKEYIVERVIKCDESNCYSKDSGSGGNENGRSYVLKFVKFLDDKDDGSLAEFIKHLIDENCEVYLSNSWNTLFVKKYLSEKENIADLFKIDKLLPNGYENKIEDIQTFIVFEQKDGSEENTDVTFKPPNVPLTTTVKTRGTTFVENEKSGKFIGLLTNANKWPNAEVQKIHHLSGISDYMINWNADSISSVEAFLKSLINDLSNINDPKSDSYFGILTSFIFKEKIVTQVSKNNLGD